MTDREEVRAGGERKERKEIANARSSSATRADSVTGGGLHALNLQKI